MKRILYRKILKKLQRTFKKLLGKPLKGHQFARLRSLAAFITGMIRTKSSHLSAIGKGLLQLITAHSKTKAAKKFVYNRHIDYETYYLPYLKELLKLVIPIINSSIGIFLVIDGSQTGKHHAALMLSLVIGKRSLPICWLVKQGGKGHFKTKNHLELMEQSYPLFETALFDQTSITLLGDGEFDSIDLQKFCRAKHWNYVFRTANNTLLYEDGDCFKPKQLATSKLQDSLFISNVEFTKQRFKGVNFLLWHDKKYEEPLPLVSNLDCALDIIHAYDKRYSVECLFKDLKSTSFYLDKTRLQSAEAISNLIMIAAFAFTLIMKLGRLYQDSSIRKYIHRLRPDRIVNSIYTFALELLDFLLEQGIDFCFDRKIDFEID